MELVSPFTRVMQGRTRTECEGGTTPILKVLGELQTVMGMMGQGADSRTLATFGVAVRMSQRDGKVAALEEVTAKSRKLDPGLHQHEKRALAVPSALGSQV